MKCPKCQSKNCHQFEGANHCDHCECHWTNWQQEKITRLRAALEKIANIVETENTYADGHKFDCEDRAYYDGLRFCAAIAYKALEE
jgi:hypothetical protein